MAKKKQTNTTNHSEKHSVSKFCAFWGLAIVAVIFVIAGILSFLRNFGIDIHITVIGIFQMIGNLALLVAIALPAYSYVRGKGRVWRYFYYAALVFYVFGVVFGVIHW